MTTQRPPNDPRAKAEGVFSASQARDESLREEIACEQAKVDAKTAKLRALRLAKEAADREAGVGVSSQVPKKRVRRVNVT